MLTVCIPVYNKDVTTLVTTLMKQINASNENINVVLIDDKSSSSCVQTNKNISKEVLFIPLDQNVGRSKIRNKFLEHTDSKYLLFLDCDSKIIKDDFIENYLKHLNQHEPKVLVGASVYTENKPSRHFRLRWKYGSLKESKTYSERISDSNFSFKTNNFIISRTCFVENLFNETISGYGHEDTLFGHELRKKGIQIDHIDNPVLNDTLDTNQEFIVKTEEGLHNLLRVVQLTNHDESLVSSIKLLVYYNRYRSSGMFKLFFTIARKPIRYSLIKGCASLFWLDVYKLGYLIRIESSRNP